MRTRAVLGACLAVAGGCVVKVPFDPTGDAVSLEGQWRVQPRDSVRTLDANDANCADAGIDHVQLELQSVFSNEVFTSPRLRWPCPQGGFETGEGVLARGRFRAEWVALRDSTETGEPAVEVDRSVDFEVDVRTRDHAKLPDAVFTVGFDPKGNDVSLEGTWQIRPDPAATPVEADSASCAAAGVDRVRLELRDAEEDGGRFTSERLSFSCARGGFDTRPEAVIAHGRYRTQWVGIQGSGRNGMPVAASATEEVDLRRTDHRVLPQAVLEVE